MRTAAPEAATGAAGVTLRSLGCIFICALLAVLPLIFRGNSFGHDFDFHLLSWMETAQQWREGVFYPHWLTSANYGAGEPRFVFYPPASWMLGSALGLLTNWALAPVLYIFVSLFFSGVSFYFLAKEWMPHGVACIAACFYAVNPYVMFNAYERSAYGELLATVWMPLLLLFALRRRSSRSSIVPLALAVAAVWLTNAPAGVMACYLLAGLAVLLAIADRRPEPLLRIGVSVLLGLGLSSFYLLPAAYERRWVEIARAVGSGMRVEDSFLFAREGDPFHVAVLATASWIAVIQIVLAGVCFVTWRRRKERAERDLSRIAKIGGAMTVVISLMLLPLSDTIWRHAPELRFLQFPWRWLLVQSVATALLMGVAIRCARSGRPRSIKLAAAALIVAALAMIYGETRIFFQLEDDDVTLASQLSNYRAGLGTEGTDEYTPLGVDNSLIPGNVPLISLVQNDPATDADDLEKVRSAGTGTSDVRLWKAENKAVDVSSDAAGFAVLRLVDYPAWRVTVNGSEQRVRRQRGDGLMVIAVPPGATQIAVKWKATPDAVLGRCVSAISVLILLAAGWMERRKGGAAQV